MGEEFILNSIIRRIIQYMLLVVILLGGVYAIFRFQDAPRSHAGVGDIAPPFSSMDLEGKQVRLKDYKGKGVLINFWASWCNPCVNELPLLNEAYKLAGVDMLAINVGEKSGAVQKFVERYELEFPIVMDSDLKIKQAYQVVGMPLTLLIDEEGTIIDRHEGELTEMEDILKLMNRIKQE